MLSWNLLKNLLEYALNIKIFIYLNCPKDHQLKESKEIDILSGYSTDFSPFLTLLPCKQLQLSFSKDM